MKETLIGVNLLRWIEVLNQLFLFIRYRFFRQSGIFKCESCNRWLRFEETILISGILPHGYDDRIYCNVCGMKEVERREEILKLASNN